MSDEAKQRVLVFGPPKEAVGGVPTHIRNLLGSPLSQRYDLIQFEAGSRGKESPAKDEKWHHKVGRLLISPFSLASVIIRERPVVAHINSGMDHRSFWRDSVYLVICRLWGLKIVMQMHGGSLRELCPGFWMRRIVRASFSLADEFVVIASSQKLDFEELGIREGATIIPNAIDVSEYSQTGVREHSGSVQRLAFMGRLIRPKGVFEVMEAVRILRSDERFRDLELEIAGSGPVTEEIETWIESRQMRNCVKVVGSVSGAEKIEFLRRADVFVFPSYHREGLPYVIIESLAAGTPVIASRVAGIPDIVIDRRHGILVDARDPGQVVDAIRELATSRERLRTMSSNCAVWAEEELGFDKFAERFSAIYSKVLQN